jgi:KUP system potassium uptake protein
MNITATGAAVAEPPPESHQGHHHAQGSLRKLAIGAIGIVYGDIGTSPIYAFRETFAGHHHLVPDTLHIYGVLSLIFWSMMIIVTLKYVSIIMRADNKGEGGSLALLALINRSVSGGGKERKKWTGGIVLLGVFATALFYGDSMITPAISVLSAVEGLTTVNPAMGKYVIPLAIGILVGLFAIQSRGTAKVGLMFAPIMLIYFLALAVLGVMHIMGHPAVLYEMLNPWNAVQFYLFQPLPAFIAMGSVVLAVTGAEALYADMGHFGRNPISVSWLVFVLPALLLNYMGQGAMLLSQDPAQALETVKNPFFYLAPEMFRLPLVLLATAATIIASQAVISGAFSVTQQAIQLGFIPRLRITHTSEKARGQIYIPIVNWALMVMVILLVLTFQSSSNLAACLWHRRHRRDDDRQRPHRCRAVQPVALEQGGLDRSAGDLLLHRFALLLGEPAESAGRRLVPVADRRHRVHLAHHLGARPQADDRPDERGGAADGGVHQVGLDECHQGAGDSGVHDHLHDGRTARAAAQFEAQQGAARAGHAADGPD